MDEEELMLDELFKELREREQTSSGVPTGWARTAEIQEKLGWTKPRVLRHLRELDKQGRLKARRFRVSVLGGGHHMVPHYSINGHEDEE